MRRLKVFDIAVNVSQVQQRSPFRYPGGKTWLIPTLKKWMSSQQPKAKVFVEPFAGGASASLFAVAEHFCDEAHFAEMDSDVASVWQCVLSSNGPKLADSVKQFQVSESQVEKLFRAAKNGSEESNRALAVLVKNRIQRGGVLAPGAGRLKEGENGKGLSSRWYPETLASRLEAIYANRSKLHFRKGDGFQLLKDFSEQPDTITFVDPPYFLAAHRLYNHWAIDHRSLFALLEKFRGDFLLAYDDAPQIRKWVAEFGFNMVAVEMKTTHHKKKRELLIGRNFSWLNQKPEKSEQAKAAFVQVIKRRRTSSGKLVAA